MTTTAARPTIVVASPPPPPGTDLRGGTRWRRTGILLVPGLIVVLVLTVGLLRGWIPLNLVISGQDFKITSNGGKVEVPNGITLYPATVQMKNGGKEEGVVIGGLSKAVLDKGMCLSLVLTFPVIGTWTVQLHTSGKTIVEGLTLDGATLNASSATLLPQTTDGKPGHGSNVIANVKLGQSADEVTAIKNGPPGSFSVIAPGNGSLSGLRATGKGIAIQGTAKLAGLGIPSIHHGRGTSNGECF